MKKHRKKSRSEKNATHKPIAFVPEHIASIVRDIADPLCRAEGMELIHVEYQREPAGWILRLYIGKPGGVTIADCTTVSKQLKGILGIKLDAEIPYILEISSPGPDRPLSKICDFERFAGHIAKIRTRRDQGGRQNYRGTLLGILDDYVLHMLDAESVAIPYREITKARLVNYNGDKTC